jgi:hypothetical protein
MFYFSLTAIAPSYIFLFLRGSPQDAQGNVIVSSEAGIVLGLASCPNNPQDCIDPSKSIGTMLYNGDFYPVFGDGPEPNVNITIQIPEDTPKGAAQLNLGHFFLLGVSDHIRAWNFK